METLKTLQDVENEDIIKHNGDNNSECPMGIGRDFCQYCQYSKMSMEDYENRCNYKVNKNGN